ncbi:hypothetical protein Rhe02_54260 [Rhizocola hellebori]|uniref:Uncharacterized protein n=1 Tax=Rhizocola hellebori TaxID=1392758 RepID=A0A8J3VHF9_9ACTN|nr:hypothetical protein [Rhizocola hellebori]GIH07359.1 hypothetical protein Rhe02_54260 [Rhizocola hellebori]
MTALTELARQLYAWDARIKLLKRNEQLEAENADLRRRLERLIAKANRHLHICPLAQAVEDETRAKRHSDGLGDD